MALEFHFEDIPPQIWLDELHTFNITGLWNPRMGSQQRENLIQRTKDELKKWRLALRDQMETIKMRYGDENKEEMRLMIAPYHTLDSLGNDLNNAIRDLESKLKAGRALPVGIGIGTHIFGSLHSGRWYFGDDQEMKLWEEFELLERRYRTIKTEYDEQSGEYKITANRVKEHQVDIKKLTKEYKARQSFVQLALRLLVVFLATGLSLILGIMAFTIQPFQGGIISNEAFGGIMLIIAVVGVMIAIVLSRRRRRRIKFLREEILTLKRDAKMLKQEAQRLKKSLYPTHHTFKEISAHFNEMKKAFH
jgi:hypothetical protein